MAVVQRVYNFHLCVLINIIIWTHTVSVCNPLSFPQISEFVHKRTVTRNLLKNQVTNPKSFDWLCQMRFYFDPKQNDPLKQLSIHMANAKFNYGFEYLGVQDKLVQTPLTDRCYLTMTQALEARLGGSPFGKFFCQFLQ